MRIGLMVTAVVLTAMSVGAQRRYPCTANLQAHPTDTTVVGDPVRGATRGTLGYPRQQWDPQRTYRQPVVLINFEDCDFSMAEPAAWYDRVLNEPGYNEGAGPGSMADYFRDQSRGRFNLQFDVFGPIRVDEPVKSDGGGVSYGGGVVYKALQRLVETSEADFSPYDWDGDGCVDQVICIAAGYTGSQVSGHVWPNTGKTSVRISSGLKFSTYSLSCELWADGTSCGIGTVCHEFSHCLGLPDLYPLSPHAGMPFSVVDEWDLMDGGNFTGRGWCPPNYSVLERMLLGWEEPHELTAPASVTGMRPAGEGGESYIVRNPANADEYFLIENRQRTGWDYGLPGEGLLIAHVDYHREQWSNNMVNTTTDHFRYDLVHADNRDYRSWDPANNGRDPEKYTMEGNLRNRYLSTSAYPWTSPETGLVNRELSDTSVPAATVFAAQTDGRLLLSRPVTNIHLDHDRTISFDFMGDVAGIKGAVSQRYGTSPDDSGHTAYYDLTGRRLQAPPRSGSLYIRTEPGFKPCVKIGIR